MGNQSLKLVNKAGGMRLDSQRGDQQYLCVTNPIFSPTASPTQTWFINDEGLILSSNGKALTFEDNNTLTLQSPTNNDRQKWSIDDNGLIKCKFNNFILITQEDNYENNIPAQSLQLLGGKFSDDVRCVPQTNSNIQPFQQWEIRDVETNQLRNDLLKPKQQPTPQPTPQPPTDHQFTKIGALGLDSSEISGDFNDVFWESKPFEVLPPKDNKNPRLYFIYINHAPHDQCYKFVHEGGNIPTRLHWVNLDFPEHLDNRWKSPRPNDLHQVQLFPNQYITKITTLWIQWSTPVTESELAVITQYGGIGLRSMTCYTNTGHQYTLGLPDLQKSLGAPHQTIPFPLKVIKTKNLVLEAPAGHQVVGFHGTTIPYYHVKGRHQRVLMKTAGTNTINTLGIYTSPVR